MKEEVIQAAQLIKNHCRATVDCEYCPFYDTMYEDCGLKIHCSHWGSFLKM